MPTVEEVCMAQRAKGPATILAIGTANPPTCYDQSTYPDFYFRITNSEHKTELKEKFERICNRSMIKKRYLHMTEEILKEHPNICSFTAPSLNPRQDLLVVEVPKLGEEAAEKAIAEWGQPKSKITHLIFCTTTGVDMPGADFQLAKLLGLSPYVKRFMMYQQGCFGAGTVLRLAKDVAENNAGARVLVVCSESTVVGYREPSESEMAMLVGHAIFGDGAGAVIVGSDPMAGGEHPLFQIVSTVEATLPNCECAVGGHLREEGLIFHISKDTPELISNNIEESLKAAFDPLGISDWNSIFWIPHQGGPAILNRIESKLGLDPQRLRLARHSLAEYGNMMSVSVLFILDQMRKVSAQQGFRSTGEGLDWGVLFGFGPGLTIETVVLHSMPCP